MVDWLFDLWLLLPLVTWRSGCCTKVAPVDLSFESSKTLFKLDGLSLSAQSSLSFFGVFKADLHSNQRPRLFDTAFSKICNFKKFELNFKFISNNKKEKVNNLNGSILNILYFT